METRKPTEIPADMKEVRQQLESWRGAHAHRSRIPEELWSSGEDSPASWIVPDVANIETTLATFRQKLPFLVDLRAEERSTMPKLGDKSHAFVKKALDIGTQHPDMLSLSFLEEMRKDAQLFERLAPIKLAIDLLKKQLDDTVTQVGAEAYAAARTVYAVTKAPFVRAAMRTAADDLGKRFGRKLRNTTATVESTPSSPEAPLPALNAKRVGPQEP